MVAWISLAGSPPRRNQSTNPLQSGTRPGNRRVELATHEVA
jgi:hypothetical protein